MRGRQTNFFADEQDIHQVINAISSTNICYYGAGAFDTSCVPSYQSLASIPHLGTIEYGDWNSATSIIAMPTGTQLIPRAVKQRAGGVRYHIDQLLNPQSVIVRFGGIFQSGILVASHISTLYNDPATNSIYNALVKPIRKQRRIGAFYVGESSYRLLRQGWRLVTSAGSPTEYDLVE